MTVANRTALRVVQEVTNGTTPASPAFQELSFNSSSIGYAPKQITSNAIIADRQVFDSIIVGFDNSGDFVAELAYGGLDILWPGAMFNTWTNTANKVNTASGTPISGVTNSTSTFTVASGGTAFKAGMLVKTTGFTNSGNNGVFKVTSSTGTTIVVSGTLTDEASPPAGATIKVAGAVGGTTDISATTAGLASSSLDFTTLGLTRGMWIKIGGTAAGDKFATSALNGWARISAIATNLLTLDTKPTGWTTDAGTGKTIKFWWGDYMRNGTVENSYTFEIDYQDMAVEAYEYFAGMEVKTVALQMNAQAIPTVTFSFMGTAATQGTTRFSGATTLAPIASEVMNTSSNVATIREGGSEVTNPNYVMSLNLNIENNLRFRNAIGSLSAIGIGNGRCNVTGSIDTYFGDMTMLNKLRNDTESSLDFVVVKSNQAYVFDIPRVNYSSEKHPITGIDTDIMITLNFQGLRDATLGYTLHMQRLFYLE